MAKLRIGHDLDGVFYNFGESVQKTLEATGQGHVWKSGKDLTPYWDFYKDWGWETAQFLELCNQGADMGIIFTGEMREGTYEAWRRIEKTDQEIVVVTDRAFGSSPQVSHKNTLDWLNQHGLWYDELIFSADKTVGNCDMFVDDKIQNYDALTEAGTLCYLLNRPWNCQGEYSKDDGRNRIDDVCEFADAVEDAVNSLGLYLD